MSFLSIKNPFSQLDSKKIYFLSLVIGVLSGLGAALFYYLLAGSTHFIYDTLFHIALPEEGNGHAHQFLAVAVERRWLFLFIPCVGGFLVGLLTYWVAPEAAGTGTEAFLDSYHNKGGVVRKRTSLVKAIATIITLSTGGSAGKEGPTAQIGSGIGSMISKILGTGARARRTLLLAGTAGGLGAIFRAPLGGALTAVEVLYHEDFESDALVPCILSSVMAYTVFGSIIGFGHIFNAQVESLHSPTQWLFFIILGFVCFGMGAFFVTIFHGSEKIFKKLKIKPYLVPALGGLLVGIIGFFKPEITGASLGMIQQALNGAMDDGWHAISTFALLAILKIFATSFTISSGGSGGVFGPSLFIGGMLGGMVGAFGHHFYPVIIPHVAPFVIVGMGAFFAGVANAPIASVVMVSELTGGYELLPPLLIVSAISLIFSKKFSIYKNQVKNKFYSKAHSWTMNPNLLSRYSVEHLFKGSYSKRGVISLSTSYHDLIKLRAKQHSSDFIVEGDNDELAGIVSFKNDDLWQHDGSAEAILIAHDLLSKNINTVSPNDNLFVALKTLSQTEYDKIPIVEIMGSKKRVVGTLREKDIMKFYYQTFQALTNTL